MALFDAACAVGSWRRALLSCLGDLGLVGPSALPARSSAQTVGAYRYRAGQPAVMQSASEHTAICWLSGPLPSRPSCTGFLQRRLTTPVQVRNIPRLAAPYLTAFHKYGTPEFEAENAEVVELGGTYSATRTPYQTDTARFWLGGCLWRAADPSTLAHAWLVALACGPCVIAAGTHVKGVMLLFVVTPRLLCKSFC